MTVAKATSLTLEEFPELPETKSASEYIDSAIFQKPAPKTHHSRLQGKLIDAINAVTEASQIAYAFPELRCAFGDRSIVLEGIELGLTANQLFSWLKMKVE